MSGATVASGGARYRIFLEEDDGVIASSLAKYLESWGFAVRCAEDVRDVIGEFSRFDPQLVLLDISLPFFNGYHWCAQIRNVSKVPIIFVS